MKLNATYLRSLSPDEDFSTLDSGLRDETHPPPRPRCHKIHISVPSTRVYAMKRSVGMEPGTKARISVPSTRVYAMKL